MKARGSAQVRFSVEAFDDWECGEFVRWSSNPLQPQNQIDQSDGSTIHLDSFNYQPRGQAFRWISKVRGYEDLDE
jgi:hypothetical protein